MIHVASADEPASFDAAVQVPGLRAIAEMTGQAPLQPRASGKPHTQRTRWDKQPDGSMLEIKVTRAEDLQPPEFPDYWTQALDDLMDAYGQICAYSCFRIHSITGGRSVDHMVPKSEAWDKVYEWTNYRLASTRLNSRKGQFRDVLDPFLIQPGWFVLDLVGFQVLPGRQLDDAIRRRIVDTINRLGLQDFRGRRERDAVKYWEGEVSFDVLEEDSPFVAMELQRQNRLRKGDE